MAPKGLKRPAASSAGVRASKKPAVDPARVKCDEVRAAILEATVLPQSCKSLLARGVHDYLGVYAESRHPFQAELVQMVVTTFSDVEADLAQQIAQAEKTVASADEEKSNREAALSAAETKLNELSEKLVSTQEAHDADKASEVAAKSALDGASAAQTTKETELEALLSKKAKLDAAVKEKFEPLKESGKVSPDDKKALTSFVKMLRELEFEEGLVDSLSESLGKAPSERGAYDGIVLEAVTTQTAKVLQELESAARVAEQSQAEAVQTKESATAAHAASVEKLNAPETGSKAVLQAAIQSKADGKATVASAAAAVKNYEADMKVAAGILEDAKAALAAFKEGPAKALAELKDLAPVPEPVEELEAAPEEAVVAPVAMEETVSAPGDTVAETAAP